MGQGTPPLPKAHAPLGRVGGGSGGSESGRRGRAPPVRQPRVRTRPSSRARGVSRSYRARGITAVQVGIQAHASPRHDPPPALPPRHARTERRSQSDRPAPQAMAVGKPAIDPSVTSSPEIGAKKQSGKVDRYEISQAAREPVQNGTACSQTSDTFQSSLARPRVFSSFSSRLSRQFTKSRTSSAISKSLRSISDMS